jgi:uncharacterized protein YndB with AHSA1/START domain
VHNRQDHAECSIVIAAGVDRIWSLVSHPEWFICHGQDVPAVIDGVEPGDRVVLDDRYGSLVIHMVTLHQPSYAAFRWEQRGHRDEQGPRPTLVEFWVTAEDGEGTASVRVRESFFDFTGMTSEQCRDVLEDNAAGWAAALTETKSYLEQA